MPWSNQAVSLIVLTEETAGYSGLFGYSPAPGAGNLVFSVAPVSGTDPYGNAYKDGFTVYNQGAGLYTQIVKGNGVYMGETGYSGFEAAQLALTGAQFTAGEGAAVLYSPMENSTDVRSWIACEPGPAGGLGAVLAVGRLVCSNFAYATNPANGSAVETWHAMTLASGWSAGNDVNGSTYAPAYKMLPDGSLAIRGCLVTPASGSVTGVAFATLPSAYANTNSSPPTATLTTAAGAATGTVCVKANGSLYLAGGFGNSNNIYLDCVLRRL